MRILSLPTASLREMNSGLNRQPYILISSACMRVGWLATQSASSAELTQRTGTGPAALWPSNMLQLIWWRHSSMTGTLSPRRLGLERMKFLGSGSPCSMMSMELWSLMTKAHLTAPPTAFFSDVLSSRSRRVSSKSGSWVETTWTAIWPPATPSSTSIQPLEAMLTRNSRSRGNASMRMLYPARKKVY